GEHELPARAQPLFVLALPRALRWPRQPERREHLKADLVDPAGNRDVVSRLVDRVEDRRGFDCSQPLHDAIGRCAHDAITDDRLDPRSMAERREAAQRAFDRRLLTILELVEPNADGHRHERDSTATDGAATVARWRGDRGIARRA